MNENQQKISLEISDIHKMRINVYPWTPQVYYMSHDTTKRVFGSFQPGQTQTGFRKYRVSTRVLKFRLKNLEILYYLSSEQQRRWSACADAQADLRLCCIGNNNRYSHGIYR